MVTFLNSESGDAARSGHGCAGFRQDGLVSASGQAPAAVRPRGRAGCAIQVDRAVEHYVVHLDGDDQPVDPADLAAGAVPGTGGAFLFANSSAILTDANVRTR